MTTLETIDYENLDVGKQPDDLFSVLADLTTSMNLKIMFFLFIIFLLVTSDPFMTYALGGFSDVSEHKIPTSKGTMLQGLALVLLYIVADVITKTGLV